MKFLFIGDIHNNYELMKCISDFGSSNGYHMVFVGDYTDSFEHSNEEGIKCLNLAIELSTDHTFLLGNHDMGYMFPNQLWCQGNDDEYIESFRKRYIQIDHQLSFAVDNVLVTHAGLHKKLLPQSFVYKDIKNEEKALEISNYIEMQCINISSVLLEAGIERGGNNAIGGITWCDFYNEFEGIEDIIQVFGHTKTRNIKSIKYDYNKINFDKIIEENENNGYVFSGRNFFGDTFYFTKMLGIEKVYHDNGIVSGIDIDNLEYGEGELLEYDSITKEFKTIKINEYEN